MAAIEDYLNKLARHLPRHAHSEILPEIHDHLIELAADLQHQGLPRDKAEAQAVTQFGQVRLIGQQLRAAHDVVGWGDVVLAALPILAITGLGWQFVGRFLPLWWYLLAFGWGALVAWQRNWPTWWCAWLGWLFLALGVVSQTQPLFWVIFPLTITLIALESWERATLMALPFTTYLAFVYLVGPAPLLMTTGWGPGSVYPGNIIWLETAFSLLWLAVLALSIKLARPHRRGTYLLAGLLSTQGLYISALFVVLVLVRWLPDLFVSPLTLTLTLTTKLPVAALVFGLTLYPLTISWLNRWLRQPHKPDQPGLFAS
jgi:hypothetical protein